MQKSSTQINQIDAEVFISNSAEETQEFGERFSSKLGAGQVVALFGELGSGKTTFIKGLCRGLNVKDEVSSPTFTLINEYSGTFPVYHFDFYRLEGDDVLELGSDEYFYGDGICLIEWADRIAQYLPEKRFEIRLQNIFSNGMTDRREIRVLER